MKNTTLTAASARVEQAILRVQECEDGMGASVRDIQEETGMDPKAIRAHLTDLTLKGLITIDRKEDSGASCHMWYHNDFTL